MGATRLAAWASSAAICCVHCKNLEKFPPECNRQIRVINFIRVAKGMVLHIYLYSIYIYVLSVFSCRRTHICRALKREWWHWQRMQCKGLSAGQEMRLKFREGVTYSNRGRLRQACFFPLSIIRLPFSFSPLNFGGCAACRSPASFESTHSSVRRH